MKMYKLVYDIRLDKNVTLDENVVNKYFNEDETFSWEFEQYLVNNCFNKDEKSDLIGIFELRNDENESMFAE